jgi:hypothetical protein
MSLFRLRFLRLQSVLHSASKFSGQRKRQAHDDAYGLLVGWTFKQSFRKITFRGSTLRYTLRSSWHLETTTTQAPTLHCAPTNQPSRSSIRNEQVVSFYDAASEARASLPTILSHPQ